MSRRRSPSTQLAVQCESCLQTYSFDVRRVRANGTRLRCVNAKCGHEFTLVRPPYDPSKKTYLDRISARGFFKGPPHLPGAEYFARMATPPSFRGQVHPPGHSYLAKLARKNASRLRAPTSSMGAA
jgi:hypothetical protein